MIQSFRHKGLKQLYEKAVSKGLPAAMVPKITRILARLDVATRPEMMNLPGLGLHPAEVHAELHGFLLAVLRAGHQSVRFGRVVEHVAGVAILATHDRACSTIEDGYADG